MTLQHSEKELKELYLSLTNIAIYMHHFGSKQFAVKLFCKAFLGCTNLFGNDDNTVVVPDNSFILPYLSRQFQGDA